MYVFGSACCHGVRHIGYPLRSSTPCVRAVRREGASAAGTGANERLLGCSDPESRPMPLLIPFLRPGRQASAVQVPGRQVQQPSLRVFFWGLACRRHKAAVAGHSPEPTEDLDRRFPAVWG